jgi:predicted unusual protein kinase regulating ubiquinone biosynthesis (AarF/ABC1/UbiB family)
MTRQRDRLTTFARAAMSRLMASARRVLTTDPETQGPGDEAEAAEARELARAGGELKGGMAKLAQLMGYQLGPGGVADADARAALGELWDHAPGVDRDAVRRVVSEDLGAPPEEVFAAWEDEPFAAASLGQVHRARTRDGIEVAVKVQYPGVAEALRSDLSSPRILRRLAGADVGRTLSHGAAAVLRDAVLAELDYVAEAKWLERFRRALAGERDMVVPRLHGPLSSARVLTADYLTGTALPVFDGDDETRAAVARLLFRFCWGAPLGHRLLNADPNPGNYLVLPEGRVGFLDFGCAVELDEELVAADRSLWRAVLRGDGERLRYAVVEEGLLARARTLDSDTFRRWEAYIAAPFSRARFDWTAGYAKGLAGLTSQLVRAGGMSLPPGAFLLWRQRLGAAAVIGMLGADTTFREEMERLLADSDVGPMMV